MRSVSALRPALTAPRRLGSPSRDRSLATAPRSFIDESFRQLAGRGGMYLFSAVMVSADQEEEIRERLRRALPGRIHRFHWREDTPRVRQRCIEVMRQVQLTGLTLYQFEVSPHRAEATRQHMMWSLVFELQRRGVTDLVFEARERSQNQRDQQTLASIARTPAASGLRYTFARPLDEELLWLPDYLAGVQGMRIRGRNPGWTGQLSTQVLEVVEVPPRRPRT